MHLQSRIWVFLSVLLVTGAVFLGLLGLDRITRKSVVPPRLAQTERASQSSTQAAPQAAADPAKVATQAPALTTKTAQPGSRFIPTRSLPGVPTPAVAVASDGPPGTVDPRQYRLHNTDQGVSELALSDSAVLLENAWIDTRLGVPVEVPETLRADGDAGAYLVQASGPLNRDFYALLKKEGAEFVSYIPNNAALVRASEEVAWQLSSQPLVQAVLPYEPYYKLAAALMPYAVDLEPTPLGGLLNVVGYPGQRDALLQAVTRQGGVVLGEDSSPFGPLLTVQPVPDSIVDLAQLQEVQRLETSSERMLLNDLSRTRMSISTNTVTLTNYLELTGKGIPMNINDTGVDQDHPDLVGRVSTIDTNSFTLRDLVGHGTHVAGIMAGDGASSDTVTNAYGSLTNANFRGMAPDSDLFVLPIDLDAGPLVSDSFLQRAAATNNYETLKRTNVFVSNNSWGYRGNYEYNSAAASFDAAVRDALPDKTGDQSVVYVFAAGNSGAGLNSGNGGIPGTILSPATAKNVITVGAIEQYRRITEEAVYEVPSGGSNVLVTNMPFLTMTDSNDEVASYSSRGNTGRYVETDYGRYKPDVVAPGSFVVSARSQYWDLEDFVSPTNRYYVTLSNLNASLGPEYRYESGTSMAAPAVSGMIALIQEFFESDLQEGYSPALLKALVINGSRPFNSFYNLTVRKSLQNFQGWGLPNLTNSLPAALSTNLTERESWPIQFVDAGPNEAIASGETHTWKVTLTEEAAQKPLRVTLVWTDPPGNPAATLKLVNDLDLTVIVEKEISTNSLLYLGNDIPSELNYNQPFNPVTPVKPDYVNNVENVYLEIPGETNLTISVRARRVNVNAVQGNVTDVVQDYALVISSANGELTKPFTSLERLEDPPRGREPATPLTNGVPVLNQHAGGNFQLVQSTNGVVQQWQFYAFTNLFVTNVSAMTNGSNVAFVTFLPPTLSRPRNYQSDIDMYVSRDPELTNLVSAVVDSSFKSLGRGGTEVVTFTNALVSSNEIFYIGVKSEAQQAAEFGLVALSSDEPFDSTDDEGNRVLRGMPVGPIPDGTPFQPGGVAVFAVGNGLPALASRVKVELGLTHEGTGDLIGTLDHDGQFATLQNGTVFTPGTNFFVIYDDSGRGDSFETRPSDGPEKLNNFIGESIQGAWIFFMVDSAPGATGRIDTLTLRILPNMLEEGVWLDGSVLPNQWVYYFIDVPADATALIASLRAINPNLPLELYFRRDELPTFDEYDKMARIGGNGTIDFGSLTLTTDDSPPLNKGRYFIGVYNPNPVTVEYQIRVDILRDPDAVNRGTLFGEAPAPVTDQAFSRSSVFVSSQRDVVEVEAAVQVDHERASDLSIYLVAPDGSKVLLAENRGSRSTRGYGAGSGILTNAFLVASDGFESATATNYFAGDVFDTWQVLTNLADTNALVTVIDDSPLADSGDQYLALRNGAVTRNWSGLTNGQLYLLSYAHRLNYTNSCIAAWWPGEDSAEDLVAGNDGVLVNDLGFTNGYVGEAFNYVTNGEHVWVRGSTNLQVDSLTVEGWISTTNTQDPLPVFNYADSNLWMGVNIWLNRDETGAPAPGTIYANIREQGMVPPLGDHILATPTNTIAAGDWNHVAVVYDQDLGAAGIYVNGAIVTWTNIGIFTPATDSSIYLGYVPIEGREPLGGATFSGRLDEISLYGCALTVEGLQDTLLSGRSGKCANAYPPIPCTNAFSQVAVVPPAVVQGVVSGLDWQTNYMLFVNNGTEFDLVLSSDHPGQAFDSFTVSEASLTTNTFFTTFTENTNLASSLIKFEPPPFTNSVAISTSTNEVIFEDSFEEVPATNYLAVTNIGDWELMLGAAEVHGVSNTLGVVAFDGDQFLQLIVTNTPSILGLTLETDVNRRYELSFMAQTDPLAPVGSPQVIGVYTNGVLLDRIRVRATTWATNTVIMEAKDLLTTIELVSASPVSPLIDLVKVTKLADEEEGYVVPEETLETFEGLSALGDWTLEVWDNRIGPNDDPEPVVVDWLLHFIFSNTNPPAIPLTFCTTGTNTMSVYETNCVPQELTLSGDEIKYFSVQAPAAASFATNRVWSTNDLVLLYSQDGLPDFDSDLVVNANGADLGGLAEELILTTNLPPLFEPGQRYYLAVANFNVDETNTFFISAAFDAVDSYVIDVLELTNNIPYTNTIPVTNVLDYYQYDVSTNAVSVSFQVTPFDGDVGLVVRKRLNVPDPLPAPFPGRYDYFSNNPGTNIEEVIVTPDGSLGRPISAGVWYLGVYNNDTNAVTYEVLVVETLATGVTNFVDLTDSVAQTLTLTAAEAANTYFRFNIAGSPAGSLFEAYGLGGDTVLYARQNDLPTAVDYTGLALGSPGNEAQLVFRTSDPPPAPANLDGLWYVRLEGVPSNQTISFTVRATVESGGMLVSGLPMATTVTFLSPPLSGVLLSWNSVDGENYEVFKSTDLFTWSSLGTVTAVGIQTDFIDPTAIGGTVYYQVVQIP